MWMVPETVPVPRYRITGRIRRPPLPERIGTLATAVLGEERGKLVYAIIAGIKRKSIPASTGKLVLERVLPSSQPVQLDLPQIDSGAALIEAEAKITTAMNAGAISPAEARTLQAWAKHSWRARRVASVEAGHR